MRMEFSNSTAESLLVQSALLFERGGHCSSPLPWHAFPSCIGEIWQTECDRAVAQDDSTPLHAQRDGYRNLLFGSVKLLEAYLHIFDTLPRTEHFYKHSDRFSLYHAIEKLKAHRDKLFPRWKTIDDLEEILLDHVGGFLRPLHEDFYKSNIPPQSWYDEPDFAIHPEVAKS